ncbi:MAG: crossover junction endodeoxyribonuclease RuvC, partial [Propionibacteriaceae bacterium]|nr:crossover junction endodeoxyribonuclease RuvC [Propionibacteriaceae bacterium]
IAMLLAARHGLPVVTHTPTEVKAAITGSGSADKAQVGAMVTRILRLSGPPRPADAADAVALALCHLWRGGASNRYAAAVAQAGQGVASPGFRKAVRAVRAAPVRTVAS